MKPIFLVVLVMLTACGSALRADDALEYNRDIRPILAENCFACHGPDSASRKADMRLDRHDDAVESGSIVPGDPQESELVHRIESTDPEEMMPPPASHKKLSPEQRSMLRRWVASGAAYQPHWSLIAPKRVDPPAVKHEGWPRTPIDRFILAKLEAAGLEPAAEADRRTLARRVSLDLTGLPPMPADVEAFVNDADPAAYEKFVDRLLASPQWGEHRGRYWLDVARYADTHGIHFDNYREMWSYRDWVIGAFNRNVPFDQFTVEQLAGDLLPNRTLEQRVASGFNRCNITTNEGGAIADEYLVLYTRDRTETTSQVWLGMTTGCAVCHDHKFDPISQREFYSLAAFFNNTTQAAMDKNVKDTAPIVVTPRGEDRVAWDGLEKEFSAAKGEVDERQKTARAEFAHWLEAPSAEGFVSNIPTDGLVLGAPLGDATPNGVSLTVAGQAREVTLKKEIAWQPGHVAAKAYKNPADTALEIADAGDFEKDQTFSCGAWIKVEKNNKTGSIVARLDNEHDYRGWDLWLENGRLGMHMIHLWDEDAIKILTNEDLKMNQWQHVLMTYDGLGNAKGVKFYINGAKQETRLLVNKLKGTIRTEVPFKVGQRDANSRVEGMLIQDLRIFKRELPIEDARQLATMTRAAWLAAKPAKDRSKPEEEELLSPWLAVHDKTFQEIKTKLAGIEAKRAEIAARGTVAHVMEERPAAPMSHILFRGEYDQRRDEVAANTPAAFPPMPAELPKNRLGFAQWLLRPEHPLTAHVTVNRFWQEVFGTGIVRTAGDFGVTGELPSHGELLDWLAVDFRESGWDVKRFFKQLVTSAAYRQSAQVTREKLEKDAANRLISRGARFRMDAEMLRDYALAASGLLVPTIGGPSVKPYQPEGVWEAVAMIGSNTRNYERDAGEKLYRRSMYTFWKRSAPPASMDVFNAPSREFCTVRRERTNTPLQALAALNDPQLVEAARRLAEQAIQSGSEDISQRLDFIARRVLCRPLQKAETEIVQTTATELLDYYRSHTDDAKALIAVGEWKSDAAIAPAELAAWTMVANELLNLDEALNK